MPVACGNAACGKALAPPLLQCSKCKAEAYCCKACQVGDPAAPAAHSAPFASAHPPASAPFPLPAPPRASAGTVAGNAPMALEPALVVNTKKSETGRGKRSRGKQ